MKPRVGEAVGRITASGFALAVALLVGAGSLAAQQTTGKLEGNVTDQGGVPIANAQVIVVGTSFTALTNERGYYFINNVPVGSYTLRAQFIGYAPTEVRGVRVLGGQTVTENVRMAPTAVAVAGITIEAAANPIVPRDQVTSKTIIAGDLVDRLPIDDVRGVITLQPGVVESGSGAGVSIRGGRPGEANVYIDGAPVRGTQTGSQGINVGTNAVEEASVTTGALGVEFSDAQSGIISYTTRAGGEQLAGSFVYETDEPFGNSISVGFNRFEGSIGGPVPMVQNLRFFASGVLRGQTAPFTGAFGDERSTYVWGSRDTTVRVTDAFGSVTNVDVPKFIQYSGNCPADDATSPVRAGGPAPAGSVRDSMLNNYGSECQGRRLPYAWSNTISLQGTLQYTYGRGSTVRLTGLAEGSQSRGFPGVAIGDPRVFGGSHSYNRLAVLNVDHTVFRTSERALALKLNLSWARDRGISGPLDPETEIETRNPTMGIVFSPLNFAGYEGFPFPITEDVIRNIRTNTGLRVPLLDRGDLRNSQEFRMNPYGLQSGGWITSGFDVGGTLSSDTRLTGRLIVDWQVNRFHRLTLGADGQRSDVSFWSSGFLRQAFMDAYIVEPEKYGLFAADRLDLGDVVLELGVRWDYFNANALFTTTPARAFTHLRYDSLYATAGTDDAVYAAYIADTVMWTPSVGHKALSPRLRVSFPVTENTNFRLSYAHQVQSQPLTLFQGINNDLSFTNTNDVWGRDLRFGKTILFEFGVRHAFSDDMVLDIAAYNKDNVSNFASRIRAFPDPASFFRKDTANWNVLTNADFGNTRGVDIKLDRRVGSYVNAAIAYTFQVAKNTGSDPFSYLRTLSRQISQVTGERVAPPEAALPTDDNRSHNLVGAVAVTLPSDWRRGTTLGTILRDVGVFATFRVVSGLPYTRQKNDGSGAIAPRQGFGLIGTQIETLNSSTLPWTRNVDIRLNKGFTLGRFDWTLYVDARNVFNFKNIERIFAETGDVVNETVRTSVLDPEFTGLQNEARAAGALVGNDIQVNNCGTWTNVVNCVMLRRTEQRFGDGDGTYTLAEQTRALDAYYNEYVLPRSFFYGGPRHIRVGFEVNF